ncbi:MAG: HDOD domain-containing protein [Spirochaetaceae bacterium]|nr:HDOD domain-containing protein [Spirochaetaceae bacterium]
MDYTNTNDIVIRDIKEQFNDKGEYSCTLPFTSKKSDVFLSHVLRTILTEIKQENLFVHLEYVLNELAMNASKANSKRLYFTSMNLDINNSEDYEKGMITFKKDVLNKFKEFEKNHYENNSFVNISLKTDKETISINIVNNSPLLQPETALIAERLQAAHGFEDLTDVFNHNFSTKEGRGLGLIIIVLMLRKLSLNENAIVFKNEGSCCTTTLKVPLSRLSKDHGKIIADEITNEIQQMPQFPESIVSLQKELSEPNCSFKSIAGKIDSDPSLTAEILRIANSPVYKVRSEIKDVAGAVRIMGMLGVKSVLYNYGVNKVMSSRYNRQAIKEVNEHSYYVARVSSYLAIYKNLGKIAEDIYVAALLHDIGKIIVNSMNKELESKLKELCTRKYIPISILEDLTKGYNHSMIGSEVAEKWNFPEKYISAIAYHHMPYDVSDEYKTLIYAISFGNEIYYYNKGERDFNDLNYMVLEYFDLENEEHFHEFIQSLKMQGFEG